jgi:hypothetical protein
MSAEIALYQLLANAGSSAGSAVYPLRSPDTPSYPHITYQMVSSNQPGRSRDGRGDSAGGTANYNDSVGAVRERWQVTSRGLTYEQARVLAGEIRPYLDGFGGTVSGTVIQAIYVENEQDLDYETGSNEYHRIFDAIIWRQT